MNSYLTDPLLSKKFIEGAISIIKEGFIILNDSDHIEIVNEAALNLLGLVGTDTLKGKHISALFAHQHEAESLLDALDLNGRVDNRQSTFISAKDETFKGSYSSLKIQQSEGPQFLKIIVLQGNPDTRITEQKLAAYTKRLEKSNSELDQFSYIVSHDLKAPLRAISNLSLWLQEDLGPSLADENKKNFDLLRSRVARLELLINGILEYSKVGRAQIASEPVDVYMLLIEVIEMLSPPAKIQVQICTEMPMLVAPRVMLLQIFSNLIGNAIKYNDKSEGEVKISSSEKEHGYEFVIEDNGPGIPEEFFEKIFVIFQTLQSRDKFESTGIGLTIVKRIVEEHGGRIWVESELEKGSKFIFSWPKENEK